ncbi:MAG: InlB B-repeat-containing protein [Treponema sp.]|jgi:uncharacterized repeat protein (TIGR02543 family)|nr:InlB B-repeat-containing protein [Treponema sp.]
MLNVMKKKAALYTLMLLLISLIICSAFTACEDPSLEGKGLIAVTIGGGSARTAVPWASTLDSSELAFTITFSGGEGGPHAKTIPAGGGTAQFSVMPGQWTISAEARHLSGELIAAGGQQKQINPGNNGSVIIKMEEPADYPRRTISFNSKGGTIVESVTVKKYNTATQPVAPTKEGSAFIGWYIDEECNTPYGFNVPVTGDITLHAKWEVITVPVSGVSLNKTSLSLTVGENETLIAAIAPSNATDQNVAWSSSAPNIASVSASGVVSAITAGSAVITVTMVDGGYTGTCQVIVTAAGVPVTGVSLNKTTASLTVGGSDILTATVSPAAATNKAVTWSSSAPNIASVSSSGVVTSHAAGSAIITVTTADGGYTASCAVTVTAAVTPDLPGTIIISPSSNVVTGTALTATYNGNETVSYQWKKDGAAISGATGNTYTPAAAGSYTVTVNASGYSPKTSAPVTVTLPSFTVIFDLNDGISPNVYKIVTVTQGNSITAPSPAPTLTGYVFAGWYDTNDLVDEVIFPYKPTEDITLYASWAVTPLKTPSANDYALNGNGPFTYDGTARAVTVTPLSTASPGAISNITYAKTTGGAASPNPPSDAGSYTVKFDVAATNGWNGATITAGTLTISKGTPLANDFTYGNMTQKEGIVTAVTISHKSGKSDGVISNILYAYNSSVPQKEGNYLITFDVAGTNNWNSASLSAPDNFKIETNEFNNLGDFATWLNSANPNTTAAPYSVKLIVNSLGGTFSTTGSLGNVLYTHGAKFVSIDLSGSPLPDTYTDASGALVETLHYAFSDADGTQGSCTNLVGITLPASIKTCAYDAFWGCSKLTSIEMPGVTKISAGAFMNCTSLASVTIPAGVTIIQNAAFVGCTGLTKVIFETGSNISSGNDPSTGSPYFGNSAFIGNLRDVYFGSNGGAGIYTRGSGSSSNTWTK